MNIEYTRCDQLLVARGNPLVTDRQVSWLADFHMESPSQFLSGNIDSLLPAYSDEFAQVFHLFPFSSARIFISRHLQSFYAAFFL